MKTHKNAFLRSAVPVWLRSLIVIALICCLGSCGGGGSSGSTDDTDDTNDDTTDFTYLPYASATVPSVTAFIDAGYVLSNATNITFNGASITVSGAGATVNGSVVTITSAGTYNITGTLSNGQIKVNTSDAADVRLYLNGVNITSSTASPVDVENATRVILVLAEGKDNYLTDGTSNTSIDGDGDAIDACLYSKDDLVIYGGGSLTVDGNYKDGIKSKDGLIIDSGTINVTSADDGIIGKNYVSVESGVITIDAGGDGLKSTNDGTNTQGYVVIGDGVINITAEADAIQAQTHIAIKDGEFTLETNGGSGNPIPSSDTTTTAKGLKSNVGITIDGGSFDIDTSDDAFNSNDTIIINGGEFYLASGDDAIHGDKALTINNGEVNVSKCYEGIEGLVITINNGNIHVISSDDPINATDGSGSQTSNASSLYINGGYSVFNCANADGLDSNGSVTMTGGTVIVNGPVSGGNGILDYASFTMTGGFIIGAGTSDMAQAPGSQTSTQNALLLKLTQQTAGTLFHIETSNGAEVITFAPAKAYASIVLSSPDLVNGTTYNVYTGGSYSGGTLVDGLYSGGTYTPGTQLTGYTFTISSKITQVGTGGGGGGRP